MNTDGWDTRVGDRGMVEGALPQIEMNRMAAFSLTAGPLEVQRGQWVHQRLCNVRRTDVGARSSRRSRGGWVAAAGNDSSGSSQHEERKSSIADAVKEVFTIQEVDRRAAKLGIPAAGAFALEPLIALVDTAFISRLGQSAIASVAIGKGAYNLFLLPMNFLGIATLPRVAELYSKPSEASKIICSTLWVAAIAGTLIALVLGTLAPYVVGHLGASPSLLESTVIYLRYRLLSAPLHLMSMVTVATFRAFQDTVTPLYMMVFVDAVNLILFPLLLFTFNMGTAGAGIASAATKAIYTLLSLAILVKRKWLLTSDLKHRPSFGNLIALFRDGIALTMRSLSIMTVLNLANVAASKLGTASLAAFEVQRQIWGLMSRVLDAVSVAGQALVPAALGKKEYDEARSTASRLMQIALICGLLFSSILLAAANPLTSIFASDTVTRAGISASFPVMAVFLPINALVFVLEGVYSSARRFGTLSTTIMFSCGLSSIFLHFLQSISASHLNLVWVGLNTMMVLRLIILSVLYRSKLSPIPKSSTR